MDLRPAPSTVDPVTNTQPLPHRELHGEVDSRSRKEFENGGLAECTVQTNVDWNVSETLMDVVVQETKTIDSTF